MFSTDTQSFPQNLPTSLSHPGCATANPGHMCHYPHHHTPCHKAQSPISDLSIASLPLYSNCFVLINFIIHCSLPATRILFPISFQPSYTSFPYNLSFLSPSQICYLFHITFHLPMFLPLLYFLTKPLTLASCCGNVHISSRQPAPYLFHISFPGSYTVFVLSVPSPWLLHFVLNSLPMTGIKEICSRANE